MVPEAITDELRNLLWNVIDNSVGYNDYDTLTYIIWNDLYKKPTDSRPVEHQAFGGTSYQKSWQYVRNVFFKAEWHGIYDHIEFFAQRGIVHIDIFNTVLTKECAAYRLIKGQICQITEEQEIKEVSEVVQLDGKFAPVKEHIQSALMHLSSRSNPDYRNSIKESISAIESMAKIMTGEDNATLGDALKILKISGKIDPALEKGFSAIYGWTSDKHGIRHAMTDVSSVGHAEAKFYLIACSAFANYLKVVGPN
jgi:hypothetical protein